jgi:hypothetical protein
VGIYLPDDVFSHGQLYVGDSRVGEIEGLCILVLKGFREATGNEGTDLYAGVYTRNVVYRSAPKSFVTQIIS